MKGETYNEASHSSYSDHNGFHFAGAGCGKRGDVLSSQEVSRALSFEKLDVKPSKISGVIANKTPHTIQDVQLMIQYHWLWKDERNPGEHSPGRTVIIPLNEQLEPGESHSFSYTPPFSLPSRNDGYFMPEVDVAGFTTLVRQQASAR
jgi:hypothetical protein